MTVNNDNNNNNDKNYDIRLFKNSQRLKMRQLDIVFKR